MFFRVGSLLLFLGVFLVSCSSREKRTEKSGQGVWQMELLDSLVLDHLGEVYLQDISPDGSTFLGYDQSSKTFLVFSSNGELINSLDLKGEGPGRYGEYHTGKPLFLDNESFLLMSNKGQFLYDLQGRLVQYFRPDFQPAYRFTVPFSKNSVRVGSNEVVSVFQGRYNDLGFTLEHQVKSRQLESLDLISGEFSPVVPFPAESRFSSNSRLFHDVYIRPILSNADSTLYVAFSNEPKIYAYKGSLLDTPISVQTLPLEVFYEAEGVEQESGDGAFDLTTFYFGGIMTLDCLGDNQFLVGYTEGLPLEDVKGLHEQYKGDIRAFFDEIKKVNKSHLRLWDGEVLSDDLVLPEYIGFLQNVRGKDEIWFDLDYSKRENAYTVFYKVRLIRD